MQPLHSGGPVPSVAIRGGPAVAQNATGKEGHPLCVLVAPGLVGFAGSEMAVIVRGPEVYGAEVLAPETIPGTRAVATEQGEVDIVYIVVLQPARRRLLPVSLIRARVAIVEPSGPTITTQLVVHPYALGLRTVGKVVGPARCEIRHPLNPDLFDPVIPPPQRT